MSETSLHPAEALVLARIPETVVARAAQVQLMVFDVDGVLTDGSLWYGEQGETLKRFHVHDGLGLRMLVRNGVHVALLTARESTMVAMRAAELGIGDVIQGARDKGAALTALASSHGIALAHVGYLGDDAVDLPALQRAGFAVSVPNAPAYVSQSAHWVTTLAGGQGAARECCDVILAAQRKLREVFVLTGSLPGASQ